MLTREIAMKQATSFFLDCLRDGIEVEKAILFGSFAKKEQRESSDIDIALVSDKK